MFEILRFFNAGAKITCFAITFLFYDICHTSDLSNERKKEIQRILKNDCGSCHGLSLRGGLGLPLTKEALLEKPNSYLIYTILEGRRDTAMPPWKQFFTLKETEWLVNYLKGSQK